MTQQQKSIIIILVLVIGIVIGGCNARTFVEPVTTLSSSVTPPKKMEASETPYIALDKTVTPTSARSDIVITPDAVFVSATLDSTVTFAVSDLCKQVPAPIIVRDSNDLTLLSGRFSLCVLREGISAIDLDSGALVNSDDSSADIQLGASQSTLDNTVFYYLEAINSAHIDEIDTTNLTYAYCEDALLSLNRPGIFIIETGALACILTTQSQVALIRAESIDTFGGESVVFSFAIIKKQQ